MAVAVNVDAVDDVVVRRSLVSRTDEIDVPTVGHRPAEDVVQMQFRPTPEGIAYIAPVDRQDPQDTASGLRATTPMVGMV